MANVSRTQFDESKAVLKKIFQQGALVLDSDLNEQTDVEVRRRRRVLSAIIADTSRRFGDGFKVVGTGANLQVTIKAGRAALMVGSELAELMILDADYNLTGFTAWTVARTDYVYADIEEVEYAPSDDADLVNPVAGEETCRDIRMDVTFRISQGGAPGAAPAGHVYVNLATVTKTTGSSIGVDDVTVLLEEYSVTVDTDDIVDDAVTAAKINADVAGTGLEQDTDGSLKIADAGVVSGMLGALAVGTPALAADAVTAAKINADVAGTGLEQDTDGSLKVADDAITKEKINADVAGTGLAQDTDGSLMATGVVDPVGGLQLKTAVVGIGIWDMDTVAEKAVSISGIVTSFNKVRSVQVLILDDAGTSMYDLNWGGNYYVTNSPTIYLARTGAGMFDHANYDDGSINRGYVTIIYEV